MDKEATLVAFNDLKSDTLLKTLNIKFTDVGEDFLCASMPVNAEVHQVNGVLHGGATAALIETVGSAASYLFAANSEMIRGLEMSVNHLGSVKKGIITAKATKIHAGRTTHLWSVEVRSEMGKLICHGKITNIILNKSV